MGQVLRWQLCRGLFSTVHYVDSSSPLVVWESSVSPVTKSRWVAVRLQLSSRVTLCERPRVWPQLLKKWAGGMTQQWRSLNALTEDPGSNPSTRRQLTNICHSGSRASDALFWLPRALHTQGTPRYIHADRTLGPMKYLNKTEQCVLRVEREATLQLQVTSCLQAREGQRTLWVSCHFSITSNSK